MKMRKFFAVVFLMMAGIQVIWAQKMILHMSDNQKFEYEISKIDSITFVEEEQINGGTHGVLDGHEWVDLGLPSGTLWATCNVGANTPDEYGDYFAWGETTPKEVYNWSTYKWMNNGMSSWSQVNKYTRADGQTDGCWYDGYGTFIGDGLTELLPEDDAATVNWGTEWQMPSLDQCKELINKNYTSLEYVPNNEGWIGFKITSKTNGNSIFLPTAGFYKDANLRSCNIYMSFWSRSTYITNFAYDLFASGITGNNWSSDERYHGLSVRPVRKK